ncbi:ribosome biogenesis protein Nop53/GLTSCR2 [Protomyces lactucae-debilis]|uniref:Ribosome biogenesis protein NOP53 n=1 Tax=Protomyces lactucae-debilis TaxID=2754530 RepID=A0A1Y2F2M2_PROLT|nr:ribosome biogenesis protein Nop53/GLTSCR2 [Protomyces lactucae-debilis]ORY78121.1 ribosome biogenesis protein Nop53/GLTSCR2 [Protomyces lactucae-debilis]
MPKASRNHVKSTRRAEEAPVHTSSKTSQKSRKGPKAWRKNINLDTVEQRIEQLREAKRAGWIVAEQSDAALFSVDVKGDNSIKRRERLAKPLKTDEILAQRSAIAPVGNLAHKTSKLGDGIVHKKKKGPLPPSELARLKKIAMRSGEAKAGATAAASVKTQTADQVYNVWDAQQEEATSEWVAPIRAKKAPVTLRMAPTTLMADGSAVSAIETPDPGQSYNPPIEAWTALLERKAKIELERQQANEKASIKSRAAQAVDERFLPLQETAEDSEGESVAEEARSVPTRAQPKTTAQRNKEARRLRQLEVEAAIRLRKAERKAIASLDALARDAETAAADKAALLQHKQIVEGQLRKRKFGRHAMPAAQVDVQLSDELAESLRTLKPASNNFTDRYQSMLKRGLVEARVPFSRSRKFELLKHEKFSHKWNNLGF